MPADDVFADLEPGGDVGGKHQNRIGGEKPFGSVSLRLALSSRVRSSHWLAAVCAVLACREMTNRASRADALGPHRVPLVCHGAGADLLGLEWLEQLALVLQQPEV